MDFATIMLTIIGVTAVVTVMAAGGLKELIPPKPSAPGNRPASRQPATALAAHDDLELRDEPGQRGWWPQIERSGSTASSEREDRENTADNFFSDEDDFTFREPEHNRGPFSQREEDRDGLDDLDRSR